MLAQWPHTRAAMYRLAWCACALIALAGARVMQRCEVARELRALGVQRDHIATWVCIAYHESRLDTAARNPHSGDHGLFQISELYWCGPGKECGLPCAALRDDRLADDVQCALKVHKEHTRLQGDGFLAWVVYPQHCRHNTKKYVAECHEERTITPTVDIERPLDPEDEYLNGTYGKRVVENLLPPYLAVASIFRGSYGKGLKPDKGHVDWFNYKLDNVDDLKLPVFGVKPEPTDRPRQASTTLATITTTAAPATLYPPIMVWRKIETNQFRRKKVFAGQVNTKSQYPSWAMSTSGSSPSASTARPSAAPTSTAQPPSTAPHSLRAISNSSTSTSRSARKPLETTTSKPSTTTVRNTTPSFSWYTFTSRATNSTPRTLPPDRLPQSSAATISTTARQPASAEPSTSAPSTTGSFPQFSEARRPDPITSLSTTSPATTPSYPRGRAATTQRTATPSTTTAPVSSTRRSQSTTQSIFDLYLNPTKPPRRSKFHSIGDSGRVYRKLRIFSEGTTTNWPPRSLGEGAAADNPNRRVLED